MKSFVYRQTDIQFDTWAIYYLSHSRIAFCNGQNQHSLPDVYSSLSIDRQTNIQSDFIVCTSWCRPIISLIAGSLSARARMSIQSAWRMQLFVHRQTDIQNDSWAIYYIPHSRITFSQGQDQYTVSLMYAALCRQTDIQNERWAIYYLSHSWIAICQGQDQYTVSLTYAALCLQTDGHTIW